MRLEIRSVAERGNWDKERLVLKVQSDTDVGDYVVMQTGFHDESVTIDTHHAYWFPYKEVEAGDLIVLYTKQGKENQKKLKSGKRAHFFYWGIKESIWDTNNRAAVLLYSQEWVSMNPDKL